MLFSSTSCNYLDVEPLGQPSDVTGYYDDVLSAKQAINSIYSILSYDGNHNHHWYFGEVMSDNAWKGGSDWSDTQDLQDLVEWRALSSNSKTKMVWEICYQTIYRANLCISRFSLSNLPEDDKKKLLGEAYFLRAYAYFYLVRIFGDVPLIKEPVEFSQLGEKIERTPFEDVLKSIYQDFKDASVNLGSKKEMEIGRATSGAAKAYMARCLMYEIGIFKTKDQSAWKDVYDLTNEIILSKEYTIEGTNLAQVMDITGENGPESIFEIQYESSTQGGGSLSSITIEPRGGDGIEGWGWGLMCPTQDLVDEFEDGDPRLIFTVGKHGEYAFGIAHGLDSSNPAITAYFPRKMLLDDEYRGSYSNDPMNYRMFRFADVLLMNAEAAYFLNKPNEAIDRINQVRKRAREMTYPKGYFKDDNSFVERPLPHIYPQDLPNTLSGDDLYEAILHERRVELALEGHRYWDLLRTGKYEEALLKDDFGYSPIATPQMVLDNYKKHLLRGVPVMPIPASEVSSFGLKQNPGYN